MAKVFGLEELDFAREYLVIDYWCGEEEEEYYLCPARVGDTPGRRVSWEWAMNGIPCVFLDENNLCKIHHVKPHGGVDYCCGKSNGLSKKYYADAWRGNKILETLLGGRA